MAALSIHPFGLRKVQDGASLAMYLLVGFASQAQRYVSKELRVLSDAPSGQFSEPLAADSQKSAAAFFLQFPFEVSLETTVSVDFSHS